MHVLLLSVLFTVSCKRLLLPPLRRPDSDGATESTRPQIPHIHPRHLLRLHFFSLRLDKCVCLWQESLPRLRKAAKLLQVFSVKKTKQPNVFSGRNFGETVNKNSVSGGAAVRVAASATVMLLIIGQVIQS